MSAVILPNELVVGDTWTVIQCTLTNRSSGLPVNLTNCTVYHRFKIGSYPLVSRLCTIVSALDGEVQYQFQTGDLVAAGTIVGEFYAVNNVSQVLTSKQWQATVRVTITN